MTYYRKLEAWKACHSLTLVAYEITKDLPKSELYGLTSQIRRAAYSASANIAEGSGKGSGRELRRYLNISLGSLAEIEYGFLLAYDLGMISHEQWIDINEAVKQAGKLTWGLHRAISRNIGKP